MPLDGPARVLVTYASRMGSTAEIGEAIAERLRAAGLDVTVVPVGQAPEPEGFDAVVCGSAIYATRWDKAARHYIRPTSPGVGGAAYLAVRERAVRRLRRAAPRDVPVRAAPRGGHRELPASGLRRQPGSGARQDAHRPVGGQQRPGRRLPELGPDLGLGGQDRPTGRRTGGRLRRCALGVGPGESNRCFGHFALQRESLHRCHGLLGRCPRRTRR
jgi:hypothetical protein